MTRLGRFAGRGKRKTPVVYQGENAECALACVAMVLASFGHELDLGQLRDAHAPSLRGTSLGELLSLLDSCDVDARVVRIEPSLLTRLKRPAILHWDLSHYVVLVKVASGHILIHDPNRGRVRVPMSEVAKRLSGIAIEPTPRAGFQPRREARTVRLKDVLPANRQLTAPAWQLAVVALAAQALALAGPFYFQVAIDQAIGVGKQELLFSLTGFFVSIVVLEWYVKEARSALSLQLGTRASAAMSTSLFGRLLRLPPAFFESRSISGITAKFDSLEEIRLLVTSDVPRLFVDALMSAGMLAAMAFYAPSLLPWTFACIGVYVVYRLVTFESFRYVTEEQIARKTEQRTHLLQSVQHAGLVRVSGAGRNRLAEWSNLLLAELRGDHAIESARARFTNVREALVAIEALVSGYLCFSMVSVGSLSLGGAIAFFTYKRLFTMGAFGACETLFKVRALGVQLSHLSDVVHGHPEVVEHGESAPSTFPLECRDVTFRYRGESVDVIRKLSFTVQRGERWAIVGPSGVGKTSLLRLLLKLEEPSRGDILTGGRCLSSVAPAAWAQSVGVVLQGNALFSGSIRENIAFGFDAIDDGQVRLAARIACVEEDVDSLPMGFETRLEDRGGQLSAGQAQRIVIARALYRQPDILLLDEGTANLDRATEDAILSNLEALGITIIHAAHRLTVAERATHILDLANETLKTKTGTPQSSGSPVGAVCLAVCGLDGAYGLPGIAIPPSDEGESDS